MFECLRCWRDIALPVDNAGASVRPEGDCIRDADGLPLRPRPKSMHRPETLPQARPEGRNSGRDKARTTQLAKFGGDKHLCGSLPRAVHGTDQASARALDRLVSVVSPVRTSSMSLCRDQTPLAAALNGEGGRPSLQHHPHRSPGFRAPRPAAQVPCRFVPAWCEPVMGR